MSNRDNQIFEFGEFRLDTAERLLLRRGATVPLPPKVFDTLVILVRHSGHLVNKDQLMRELWPDAFVEEVNLSVNISSLRKVLGGTENGHSFIDTVPKRGYRFVAEVKELENRNENLIVHNGISARIVSVEVESEARGKVEPAAGRSGRQVRKAAVALTVLVLATATIAFAWYRLHQQKSAIDPRAFEKMKVTRLTNTGKATEAAISPDGKYVVYASTEAGLQSLWMKQVGVPSNAQMIVPAAEVDYRGLVFSRDGNYLYYVRNEKSAGVLYRMPVLGGAPKQLVVDIDTPITFSPDGKQFAFVRGYPAVGENTLMIAGIDSLKEQKLATRKSPDTFSALGERPAWSPDGKVIVGPSGKPNGSYMTILEVQVATGQMKQLGSRWWRLGTMSWLTDGTGLIFTAQEEESSSSQIWLLSYPGGELRRITNDVNDYVGVSLTADGSSLMAITRELLSRISVTPGGDSADVKAIRSNNFDGVEGISWTPDVRIVYASRANGRSDIWITDQDGSNQRALTADAGNNKWPTVSADGRYIVFMSDRTGTNCIWRMDADGSNQKQLTYGDWAGLPDFSADGRSVVYLSGLGKRPLLKVPIDGGQTSPVNDIASAAPAVSPDGKWIACAYYDQDRTRIETAIYPFAGGQPAKILDFWALHPRWTPDSRTLVHVEPNGRNIIGQPIDGGAPKLLTDFSSDLTFRFSWSRDGKHLALVRGNLTTDVVLMSNFH